MKLTINYDLSDEDDKIDHFYAMNGRKYANFINDIKDDLRSAYKYGEIKAIGMDIPESTEEQLSIIHKAIDGLREYFYEKYNEHDIKEYEE